MFWGASSFRFADCWLILKGELVGFKVTLNLDMVKRWVILFTFEHKIISAQCYPKKQNTASTP